MSIELEIRSELEGAPEKNLAAHLAAQGFPVNTRCGERGWCRGCQVDLIEGQVKLNTGEVLCAPATVRACLAFPMEGGRVVVHLPERSRITAAAKVGDTFVVNVPYTINPRFSISNERDTVCAIDLGTTTVVALLADGKSGELLARAGAFNAQMRHGDNVLTRIVHAGREGGLQELQHSVARETLAPLIRQAFAESGRSPDRLAGISVAGNTTMLHMLAGEDPTPMGVAPFTPAFLDARDLPARSLGLAELVPGLPPETVLHLLPGLSAYVGADITAGLYATGMLFDHECSVLVDLGTNGEIVLQKDGRLLACATAAGPAFEGMGLTSGTRAQHGAIERIHLQLDPFHCEIEVIGPEHTGKPFGICGSGYLDFLAEGKRVGFLLDSGRFRDDVWNNLPESCRKLSDGCRALEVSPGVEISERDVAALLQAKAAVGAGIQTLLATAGLAAASIERLYLAGGFGLHLEVSHALAIGLLPPVDPATVLVAGNTSLAGALLSALDQETESELARLRERVEVVDLNAHPDFEDHYLDHLRLPG